MSGRRSLRLTWVLLFALLFQVQAQPQTRPEAQSRPAAAAAQQATQQPAKQPELKFAIIGDTGTGGSEQYEIGRKLTATRGTFPFEFVIMLGDNLYGGERPKDFETKFYK